MYDLTLSLSCPASTCHALHTLHAGSRQAWSQSHAHMQRPSAMRTKTIAGPQMDQKLECKSYPGDCLAGQCLTAARQCAMYTSAAAAAGQWRWLQSHQICARQALPFLQQHGHILEPKSIATIPEAYRAQAPALDPHTSAGRQSDAVPACRVL